MYKKVARPYDYTDVIQLSETCSIDLSAIVLIPTFAKSAYIFLVS